MKTRKEIIETIVKLNGELTLALLNHEDKKVLMLRLEINSLINEWLNIKN